MSSDDLSIHVRGLSKAYDTYAKPSDRLVRMALSFGSRATTGPVSSWLADRAQHKAHAFWALRDVDFEVRRGETTAILGRNGAGKSTLLQIIAGTLHPSHGHAQVSGKVAAILELGAGFNPDYTGRENVLLNGQLLGMTAAELEAKMQVIEAFADIGQFIDLPVKTYSTGMYARLAFAVSTSVEPDVLIVDEALSVGDIGFQFKCFQRLRELKSQGVSILLVTHSPSNVLDHADHAILLDHGRLLAASHRVKDVVNEYERVIRAMRRPTQQVLGDDAVPSAAALAIPSHKNLADLAASTKEVALSEERFGSARAIIRSVSVTQQLDGSGHSALLESGAATLLRFSLQASEDIRDIVLGVSIRKPSSADLWGDNNLYAKTPIQLKAGDNVIEYELNLSLAAGEYLLFAGLATLESGQREELDQRWPVSKLLVVSHREQVGSVYAPIRVRTY